MCDRIWRDTGFEEKITPRRFRPTVLTDIYDQTKDIKATQHAAGHTTSAMTLEHYVRSGTGGDHRLDLWTTDRYSAPCGRFRLTDH